MGEKQYKTEWSFSFDRIGETISDAIGSFSGEAAEVKVGSYSEPIGGARSARVDLKLSVGEATVRPLTASDNLIEADLTYVGEIEFMVKGEDEKHVHLRQKRETSIGGNVRRFLGAADGGEDLTWDIRLTPDIPLDLNIETGVGESELDLTGLNLSHIKMTNGVGKTELYLPESPQGYSGRVRSGVGELDVTVPLNTELTLNVDGGVGSTKLNIPYGAAVRINADNGMGDIHMPSEFVAIEDKQAFVSRSGIWQSEGYADAEKKINIRYKGGVGSLHVRLV